MGTKQKQDEKILKIKAMMCPRVGTAFSAPILIHAKSAETFPWDSPTAFELSHVTKQRVRTDSNPIRQRAPEEHSTPARRSGNLPPGRAAKMRSSVPWHSQMGSLQRRDPREQMPRRTNYHSLVRLGVTSPHN